MSTLKVLLNIDTRLIAFPYHFSQKTYMYSDLHDERIALTPIEARSQSLILVPSMSFCTNYLLIMYLPTFIVTQMVQWRLFSRSAELWTLFLFGLHPIACSWTPLRRNFCGRVVVGISRALTSAWWGIPSDLVWYLVRVYLLLSAAPISAISRSLHQNAAVIITFIYHYSMDNCSTNLIDLPMI